MQLTSHILLALCGTAVTAIAIAAPAPAANPDALADANAEPFRHRWCWLPGEPCAKVKRSVPVTTSDDTPDFESEAEARAYAECHKPGMPCDLARRSA